MASPALTQAPPVVVRPHRGLLRSALLWTFRRAIGVYFREIDAVGDVPAATTGGRIFVANHVNGLVDPILVLTQAPCAISPIAKSTLWKIPGLRHLLDEVDAVPIIRRRDDPGKKAESNDEVFDRIAAWLAARENVLIFPEGTSHNEPHLIQVKTGAARMLARARACGARGLTFQAVALEFDARATFRSRCLLVYGTVREVDALDAEGDALVAKITERLQADLSEMLVEGETWPERLLIARVAQMIANLGAEPSMQRWNSVGRQVEAASKVLKGLDRPTLDAIEAAVTRYHELLALEGLVDEQMAASDPQTPGSLGGHPQTPGSLGGHPQTPGGEAAGVWRRRLGMLAILPLAIVGITLYFLPYQLPRLVARRADEADVVSTYKLATGLLVYPLWATLLIAGSFALQRGALAGVSVLVVFASPFAALAWLDRTPAIRRDLRLWRKQGRLEELRTARRQALDLVHQTRANLGM